MFKKILCLIAMTLVWGVFDTIAQEDSLESQKAQLDQKIPLPKQDQQTLNNKQLELILKNKKSHDTKTKSLSLALETV